MFDRREGKWQNCLHGSGMTTKQIIISCLVCFLLGALTLYLYENRRNADYDILITQKNDSIATFKHLADEEMFRAVMYRRERDSLKEVHVQMLYDTIKIHDKNEKEFSRVIHLPLDSAMGYFSSWAGKAGR